MKKIAPKAPGTEIKYMTDEQALKYRGELIKYGVVTEGTYDGYLSLEIVEKIKADLLEQGILRPKTKRKFA